MFHIFDLMPPLKSPKNVYWAFLIGLLFGTLGISIYFHSFLDLLVSTAVFTFFLLTGAMLHHVVFGYFFAVFFAGFWGMIRALSSNKKISSKNNLQ